MKKHGITVLAGLFFYVVFLAATIPAAYINLILAHYGGNNLQVANAQGTLWNGSGSLYGLEDIHWKIDVPELLLGHLRAQIVSNIATRPMDIFISPTRIEMQHIALVLPAALLSDLAPVLKSMAPGGRLSISTEDFSVSGSFLGNLDLGWMDAASGLSRVAPVGSYLIRIAGRGHQLGLQLDTQTGPLFLAGKGSWSSSAGLNFIGTASSKNEQLTGLLNLIGKPDASGAYFIRIGGKA